MLNWLHTAVMCGHGGIAMDDGLWTRRDFTKLSLAALAGATVGCGKAAAGDAANAATAAGALKDVKSDLPILNEPHVCRGLNTCKGLGKGGGNACAGQGQCASAKAHGCGGQNACKGQSGCGALPGQNDCKGKGGCAVPIVMEPAWVKARKALEVAAKGHGFKLGAAPKKG